ncbi:hypothetical protein YS9_2307 [Enterococcus sp. C1]|uniref:hypothetical protein n=1 Tax=Enterococcus sp. C1 TaxID=1182762 RepID=UPI000271DCA8|nr:hypothetical protein [Enterococcus sp. C1]EJF48924.1 hypothetical protein YS9_2307 [Enterococcus sp. C1]
MTMYYQNLMSIKEDLSINGDSLSPMLHNLDTWLVSLSSQKLNRINPYQFSMDFNYNERDVLKIFLIGVKKDLFKMFYEVRNDDDDYIGLISEKQYKSLWLDNKPLHLYSRYSDEEEEFFLHNIEVWFSLNIVPSEIPEIIQSPKKVIASPLTGNDANLKRELMER